MMMVVAVWCGVVCGVVWCDDVIIMMTMKMMMMIMV